MRIRIKRIDGQWQLHIDTKKRHVCVFWAGRPAMITYTTDGVIHYFGGEL